MNTAAVEAYVASTLLPAMGISGRPFTVDPPPLAGTRSMLHLVRTEGMPPLLLRAFAHRGQAARSAEALRHLDAAELPAPRLVFHDLLLGSRLMPPYAGRSPFITVETWIEGTRLSSLDDPEASRDATIKVARVLARFHTVTRDTWGRPSAGRFRSFVSHTLLGARRMVRGLESRGWISSSEAGGLLGAFEAWREVVGALRPFHLVHNDANRHNFVLTPAGEVLPVDLHRLAYEPFPEEVINALFHFCRKDPPLGDRFLEAYVTHAGGNARGVFEATRGFFEPINYLKRMSRRAAEAKDGPPVAEDPKMNRWREIVRGVAPPGGGG